MVQGQGSGPSAEQWLLQVKDQDRQQVWAASRRWWKREMDQLRQREPDGAERDASRRWWKQEMDKLRQREQHERRYQRQWTAAAATVNLEPMFVTAVWALHKAEEQEARMEAKEHKAQLAQEEENCVRRHEKRQGTVSHIKTLPDYLSWGNASSSSATTGPRPTTPDPLDRSVSKRCWEQKVPRWRAALLCKPHNGNTMPKAVQRDDARDARDDLHTMPIARRSDKPMRVRVAPPELRAELEAGIPASPQGDGLTPRESEPLTCIHEQEAMPHNANNSEKAVQENPLDDARDDLRDYCLMMFDQLQLLEELQNKSGGEDQHKLNKAVHLTFGWFVAEMGNTDIDLFRTKRRDLEQLVNPVMNKLCNEVYGRPFIYETLCC
jgi:hypothetical protein